MPIELLLALGLFVAVLTPLWLSYRRARRRLRGELETFARLHAEALGALLPGDDRPGDDRPGDGELRWRDDGQQQWRALRGERDGLILRLGAARTMKRSTFVEFTSRLDVELGSREHGFVGQRRRVALDGEGAALTELGVHAPLASRLTTLASELLLTPRRLELVARPSEPAVRRYSYGVRLQLDPALLARLVEAGFELAQQLSDAGTRQASRPEM